jgi:D-alanyl-lipoteichoic acid acyltransferase DltB (MBOAT superfamily)
MLFNSIEFLIFFPLFFLFYWGICNRNLTARNLLIVVSSLIFYGWWDWRFLSLLLFTALNDFFIGLAMENSASDRRRNNLLTYSLLVNLGVLGFFKYYNFFIDSFRLAMASIGVDLHLSTLQIVLPVGISFYTFQSLSYTLDVYKRDLKATGNVIHFLAFVSFFPQLVAGPIERATHLLPQFSRLYAFDFEKARDGMRRILWGLFKKVVVADTCAGLVDRIFSSGGQLEGSILLLGAVFFAFQIYGDFSGYSDIAIGTAKLFGFDLMRNFHFPYFSRNMAEFWQRWHISLSTWFRDYLYIPLGGSRNGRAKHIRNVLIIFTVSGFWHGANWTFIVWGLINGLMFLPLIFKTNKGIPTPVAGYESWLPSFKELFQIGITFTVTCLAWVFFRANNMTEALQYLGNFAKGIGSNPIAQARSIEIGLTDIIRSLFLIGIVVLFEWWNRRRDFGFDIARLAMPLRWSLYLVATFMVLYFFNINTGRTFIYFQF